MFRGWGRPLGRSSRAGRLGGFAALWGFAIVIALPLLAASASPVSTHSAAASFTVTVSANPSAGGVPLTVALSATVSSGIPETVTWAFGDGSTWSGSGTGALNVGHRYVSVGTFVSTATVTEVSGTAVGSSTVGVEAGPLVAVISASPSYGDAPLAVTFRAVVSGGTGTYTAAWAFGDGGQGEGPLVNYTFRSSGQFLTTLRVTDSANETASATYSIAIGAGSPPPTAPWSATGPATLATAGVVGAGLTFGVFYGVRRRRPHRAASEEGGDEYAALPPGVFGPGAPATAGVSARASSSEPAASEASVSEPPASAVPPPAITPSLAPVLPVIGTSGTVRPSRAPGEEPRRWSRDIVAYLGSLPNLGPDDIPTIDWTQKGMSDRLGTGQNQVSNVLRRLVAAGLVIEELQHVQGQPRRLKIYRLTMRGEALAREVRRRRPTIANPNMLAKDW